MKAARWSKEAEKALLHGIGFYGLDWFQRNGGQPYDYPNAPSKRSRSAVYAKARELFGPGGLTRGGYTLARLAHETGYHPTQLRRAGSALNQKWKRLGPNGVYLLTDEQVEDILEWLKHDFWSKPLRLYACIWCGTKARPHKGGGLCGPCYFQHRRRCGALGIPQSVRALAQWAAKAARLLTWVEDEKDFLLAAKSRLEHGKSLSREQLDIVAELFVRS
jgi:hypothetical protein